MSTLDLRFFQNGKLGSVPSLNSNSSAVLSTREEIDATHQERRKFVEVAKKDIRERRVRRMQVWAVLPITIGCSFSLLNIKDLANSLLRFLFQHH
jgi:hypothetical protein